MNDTQNLQISTTPFMLLFAELIQQPTTTITSYNTYAGVTGPAGNTIADYTDDK